MEYNRAKETLDTHHIIQDELGDELNPIKLTDEEVEEKIRKKELENDKKSNEIGREKLKLEYENIKNEYRNILENKQEKLSNEYKIRCSHLNEKDFFEFNEHLFDDVIRTYNPVFDSCDDLKERSVEKQHDLHLSEMGFLKKRNKRYLEDFDCEIDIEKDPIIKVNSDQKPDVARNRKRRDNLKKHNEINRKSLKNINKKIENSHNTREQELNQQKRTNIIGKIENWNPEQIYSQDLKLEINVNENTEHIEHKNKKYINNSQNVDLNVAQNVASIDEKSLEKVRKFSNIGNENQTNKEHEKVVADIQRVIINYTRHPVFPSLK